MTTLSILDLRVRLIAWAKGIYGTEAAVSLLIAHGTWLRRSDFVRACIECFDAYDHQDGMVPVASIAFHEIPAFLTTSGCSGSEERILMLAAELAGTDTGTPLIELLTSLDTDNVALVLDAVARAAGWRERHQSHIATGLFEHEARQ